MVVLTLLVSSIGNISVSFTNNSINLRRLGFFVSIIYIYNLFCSGAYKVELDYITNIYNYFGNIQANSKKIVKKTTMKSLGGKLKEIRELRGMTQSDLAQMLGIKSTRYANWENNVSKPSLEYLLEISRIFGKDLTFFDIYGCEPSQCPGCRERDIRIEGLLELMAEKERTIQLLLKDQGSINKSAV